ncbi:ice-binding family protein [Rhodoferax ferrireducens]|uniref:ice-binding family protein n=1 Tax=Rhodoferax ferrireducens TaxID=192843 RepID=UPI0018E51A0F|nr:ice-binding family protein [Rhodoferax ferrireducens]
MNNIERLFRSLIFKPLIWLTALLLAMLVAGCGGGAGTDEPTADGASKQMLAGTNNLTDDGDTLGDRHAIPEVAAASPGNYATHVPTSANSSSNVVSGTVVTVSFSQPMDPATINSSPAGTQPTFRLKASNGHNVVGTVAMNAAKTVARFTPTAATLTPNTRYFASVSAAAKNADGVAIANATAWSFTTNAIASTAQAPVNLGSARKFAILSKSGISTVPNSVVTGNIGVSPIAHTAITGFSVTADSSTMFSTSDQVHGRIYAADSTAPIPGYMTTAVGDMETASVDAAGRALPDFIELGAGEIGGRTLAPGLYKWGTGVSISTDVTLSGGPNDVWILQIAGTLTQAAATKVILAGGAQAKNVFWQAADVVAIGTTAHFEGIILAKTMIALKTGASMNGRLLAQTAVTLDQNVVAQPTP